MMERTSMKFLTTVGNVLVDRSPEEWIAAIMLAFLLATVASTVVRLVRWRKKETDLANLTGGLVLAASLACMVLGAGYLMSVQLAMRGKDTGGGTNFIPGPGPDFRGPGRGPG